MAFKKPVFVLSSSLEKAPSNLSNVFIVKGELKDIVTSINIKGYKNIYIDGGKTIQSFLKEDLIDELTINTIPIILGGGVSLFGNTETRLKFKCISSNIFLEKVVQNTFVRDKDQ